MKTILESLTRSLCVWPLAFCGAGALLISGCATTQSERGFTSLFDGQSLNGWKFVGNPAQTYYAKDGLLVCPANCTGDLYTDREFSDFVLRLDFRVHPGGNNGIGIRTPLGRPGEQMAFSAVEIQILDDKAPKHANIKPYQANGSIYGLAPAKGGAPNVGDWNTYEITVRGRHYKIDLNGKNIVNADLNDVRNPGLLRQHPGMLRERGRIALLGHSSLVEFRNIRIKELPRREKENTAPEGFTALFDGKTLEGWKGLLARPNDNPSKRAALPPAELAAAQEQADKLMRQNWKVENGALMYIGDGFDNLCTVRDYADFELLADWKIESYGDSGLYLRGSPQVQIWDPHTKPIKGNSHVGSGGLFNNKTAPSIPLKVADRPIGEWNRFRLLMVGDKVHVFLNDELVVRDTTYENYWEREKPLYSSGQLELQAHKTPVWFKNVYIREISPANK
jgi:hypothetical protein